MFLFLFFCGLALGAASPSVAPQVKLQRGNCPMFWYGFNGRCYKYVASPMTWADAELHCLSEEAHLVSIHSLDEHNFARNLIKNFDPAQGLTWIGLSDLHKEGSWMWSDGSKVNFVLWRTGEPNNHGGNENCGHIRGNDWNDGRCFETFTFICASQSHTVCPSIKESDVSN